MGRGSGVRGRGGAVSDVQVPQSNPTRGANAWAMEDLWGLDQQVAFAVSLPTVMLADSVPSS
jgi:hypothetical protein